MTLLLKAGKIVWKAGLGIARATQACIDICCGNAIYCCWNSTDRSLGSTCQELPCSEGMHRSGPHDNQAVCIENCDDPPDPPTEYYWCCYDGYTQSCVPGAECYGTLVSGPHATPEACEEECPPAGACCPPPGSGYCPDYECCGEGGCEPGYWVMDTGDCTCFGGEIPSGVTVDPPAGTLLDPGAVWGDYVWTTRSLCCQERDASGLPPCAGETPCFGAPQPCIEGVTQAQCDAIGGTFFPNQPCSSIPCPTDCFSGGEPSPCGGDPNPPNDSCNGPGSPLCSPAVTATITVSGVDCYRDASGNCTSLQALADACNNAFILDNAGNSCMLGISVAVVIGGVTYTIQVSLVRYMPASPPAAANTTCHKVLFSISSPFGPCGGGGTASESADHCGVLPVTHTQACYCQTWHDCSFTASGPLIPLFGPCEAFLVDMTNAQFTLTIA